MTFSFWDYVIGIGLALSVGSIFHFLAQHNRNGAIAAALATWCLFGIGAAMRLWVSSSPLPAPGSVDDPAKSDRRARLVIIDAKLVSPLEVGRMPEVQLTILNSGDAAAEIATFAHAGHLSPGLPSLSMSQYIRLGEMHGISAPPREPQKGTSIEPGAQRTRVLRFAQLGTALEQFGSEYFQKLGKYGSLDDGTPVAMRVFLFGYIDYDTEDRTFRLEFCYTPRSYDDSLLLDEAPQWNRTSSLEPDEDSATLAATFQPAQIAVLTPRLSVSSPVK